MTLSRRAFLASASCTLAAGCMDSPSSGGGKGGGGSLKCLFVTDAFSDARSRRHDFDAIAAAGYNAVYGLLDLQIGDRPNVVPGRTPTGLTGASAARMGECLGAGLTPVVGIRNDWAVRNRKGSLLPSLGRAASSCSVADFYSGAMLAQETTFLSALADAFGSSIMIQLSIEAADAAAVPFYRSLAANMRNVAGFGGTALINLIGGAQEAWTGAPGVRTAHTFNGVLAGRVSPHEIFNTDGDRSITPATADDARKRLNASGKGWILWSDAIIHGSVDPAFLKPL